MSNATLYLIQSNYAATANILNQLAQVLSEQDQVVFLGESVLCLNQAPDFLQTQKTIFVLNNETELLVNPTPTNITVLNYVEFADLCLDYARCISMK